ncbi:non-ribosomal peptide synthase/polyketide synthase [Actinomadura oligospora]|uniref:non-ribosomal peptide synthase/polyketide synthase n=1 Tax=Actinomadura oligospora TaxID=111804 RepID=UPI0004790B73|nr:non-ribosomal peptide synthetase [Actinomadura oligospora]
MTTFRPDAVSTARAIDDLYPLTALQRGMLFHSDLAPGEGVYWVQHGLLVEGDLDPRAFRRAWETVFARHAVLRTTVAQRDAAVPLALVSPAEAVPLPLTELDWRDRSTDDQETALDALMAEDRARGVDLGRRSLVRIVLVRLADRRHQLVWSHHHLLLDGWSAQIVLTEVLTAYEDLRAGRPVRLPGRRPFRDYVAWLGERDPAEDEEYWRDRLDGVTEATPLGVDGVTGERGVATHRIQLPEAATTRLAEVARAHRLTLNTVAQGAWARLLAAYSGENDVVYGVTVSARGEELDGVESMVGLLVNTLPCRTSVDPGASVADWLRRLQDDHARDRRHQHASLVRIQACSGVPAGRPLFTSLYVFESHPADDLDALPPGGLAVTDNRSRERADYPVTMVVAPGPELRINLTYDRAVIDAGTAGRLAAHYAELLTAVADDPSGPVARLAPAPGDVAAWNATSAPIPQVGSVHELITRPDDTIAVVCGDRSLTYAELHTRSNRLAHHLQTLGVGPEAVVGLCLERGLDFAVGLLAIWKAGGAYLPLDPGYPADRLAYMTADSGARIVIARGTAVEGCATVHPDDPEIDTHPDTLPQIDVRPGQLAYVIYTSGSTGRPKGVQVGHRGLVNRLAWMQARRPLAPGEGVLHKTPASFDVSLWELLWPLTTGGRLVMAEPGRQGDIDHLIRLIEDEDIAVAHFVPSLFHRFVLHEPFGEMPSLRLVVCSGEALSGDDVARFHARHAGAAVENLYGPTEASIEVSSWTCERSADATGSPPIGRPIANLRLYVLDEWMEPVAAGVPGELFIGGVGVARGYAGRPDLTGERFVADPFAADGSRLYRTGDRARWRADGTGTVEYLGRLDHQVKVRGFRVEPGEIEATLVAHPGVAAAAVLARDERLVAYVVPAAPENGVPPARDLREHLRSSLPDHLVPAVFVEVTALPLNASGKLDRAALPAPEDARPDALGALAAARTPAEEILAGIWARVLGLPSVGVHDDFFELGGHSLLATQVVSRIRAAFGVEATLADLFDHPTVRGLATAVDAMTPGAAVPPVRPARRDGGPLPLSHAQRRLWFLDRLEPGSAEYVLPMALRLRGPLDADALAAALDALVERHEVLRTRLVAVDGEPVQIVDPPSPGLLTVTDVRDGGLPQAEALVAADAAEPFDLAEGPLLRARLIRLGPDDQVLSLCMHHVVSDAWSAGLIRHELAVLYEAAVRDEPSPLPPLPVQYADFAVWQRDHLDGPELDNGLVYWRNRLADAPPLDLPTTRPRPPVRTPAGAAFDFRVPESTAAALRDVARESGATMFMTLLAGFAALLGRYAGQDDVVVGTPVAGRDRAETEGLVGFFVNTLVLRADLSGDPTFAEAVARVRREALDAYAHRDVPFERLVDALSPDRDRSRTPLFQVMFDYAQGGPGTDGFGDFAVERVRVPSDTSAFDLALVLADDGAETGLTGRLEYSTELFDASAVERLADLLCRVLERAADGPSRHLSDLARPDAPVRRAEPLRARLGGVHELLTEADPDTVAVTDGRCDLTYADLESRAGRLARRLRDEGLGPETVVALHLPRDVDLIVALVAVWKAGGGYLALDPDDPPERTAYKLADSRVRIVLAEQDRDLAAVLPAGTRVLSPAGLLADETTQPLSEAVVPGQLAAVIYTSGSTGRPKAVHTTHGSLTSLYTAWSSTHFDPDARYRWLCVAGAGFDVFTGDVVRALGSGGTLVLAPVGLQARAPELARAIAEHGVQAFEAAPRFVDDLVDHLDRTGDNTESLRLVVVTTDTWRTSGVRLARRVLGPDVRLLTAFGITEATVDSTYSTLADLAEDAPTPIGGPLPGTVAHVLDRYLAPLPPGVPGELYLGGPGLARGYGGRPDLTAERFVPDPFAADGTRLYRSGDRVRLRPDGELDFLGRTDHQVKVRGFRIEPGEIEAALTAHPDVAEAVVVARGDRLAAYLVPTDPASGIPSATVLRALVRERLPEAMTPAAFVEIAAVPLTRHGKLDHAALPDPGGDRPDLGRAAVAPRTPSEEKVADVWREVLGVADVGVHDTFFELGGHSLLAVRALWRLGEVFGTEPSLADLFDNPTVAGLAALLDGDAPRTAAGRPITPRNADAGAPAPASFAQRRLWFLDQLEPGSTRYNVPLTLRLTGPLDTGALTAALDGVVARHEALRTRLVGPDDDVLQMIDPPRPFDLTVLDLTDHPDAEAEAEDLVAESTATPFDLAAGPLVRGTLIRLGDGDHVLSLCMHHVVCDEWSSGVLWRELAALYAAFSRGERAELPPLPVQYADFAAWQRDLLTGATLDEQLGYWRDRLADAAELDLPTDRPRPAVRSADGAQVPFDIPDETAARLRDLAQRSDATLFMTLLSAFALLLGRYAGGEDVVVGAPIAGRGRAELDGLVGFFLNTIVLRTDLSGDPTVAELLGRVRAGALGAFAHQDVPFEQVVDALAPDRDPGRNPLFQVLFDVERADAAMTEGLPGLDVTGFGRARGTTPFDLSIVVIDGDGLSGALEYSTDLFDAATVRRMAAEFVHLLDAFAADPDRHLSQLAWPDPDERHRLIAEGNDTAAPVPSVGGVHELFDAQAVRTPDATAVISDGQAVSYAALAERSTHLAHHLRGLGVGRDDVVGLCVTGGVDLAVSVLGVLKAGAAYLPLDPAHPDERLGRMLADCGVRVAIGQAGTLDRLAAHPAVHAVDAADPTIATPPAVALPETHPDQLAFVIYTSGSTGRPKGVLLTHRGLVNVLAWRQETFALRPGERMLQKSAIGFDAATGEILWPLSVGGTVVMADPERRADLDHLVALVRDERIDVLDCVPSLFRLLVRQDGFAGAGLRLVVCGGEALSGEDVARFQDADPDAAVHNVYGPTEASIDVSAWACERPVEPSGVVPIGGPVANTRLYVLDAALNPVPDGAPGELYIAGAGLARGYAGGPDLTAGRFVPDPFTADGARMYRSGDRVRRRHDGALAFLGRTDGQLKIRGIRVEPGEVEAALRRHPAVATAAVTARDGRLVGYAVPADPAAGLPAPDELRAFLRTVLPAQLVPAAVVELASLPVRANGKLDTGALPEPDPTPGEPSAPRTPAEEVLAGIWARVLDLPEVGATDDFFALGGHSLLATRVVSRVRTAFETELPVAALFEHPTVRRLAEAIGSAATGLTAPPLLPADRDGLVPASFAQQRLWFQDQLEPGSTDFNVPVALRLRGPLDADALGAAVDAVTERHEALRTRFRTVDGTATQVIDPPATALLRRDDLSGETDPLARATALAAADAGTPFDLADGRLCRWNLYRLGPDDHVFTMVMHHIVCDEWSAGVLGREIAALYGAFREGRPAPLAPLPVQYADYAVWQRDLLSGGVLDERLGYWRDRLAGAPVLDVPADRPRPPVRTSSGAVVGFAVPDETGRGLRELGRTCGATLFMTLLGAYAVLLARFTGQDDILVGTPDAGRDRAETEGLAGFFVNTLVLRADLSGDPTFAEVVARIRRDALAAFAHRDVPFEQVVDGLRPVRDRSRTPVFQALFNYDQEDGGGDRLDLPGLDVTPLGIAEPIALTDVRLAFTDAGDGLGGIVEYSTELFDPATVERLVDRLRLLLDEVVADPTLRLSQLTPLPASERERVTADWNSTEAALPEGVASVADMVAAWALTSPAAPAVTDATSTLTYARLDADASRLAHHLRALGAGPETIVGLCLSRGADMMTAMLATLRAGAAFLPLDPALPADRLAHMVTDSRASVLVGTGGTLDDLPAGRVPTLELDDQAVRAALDAAPPGPDAAVHPDGLAYVIYTSGSTGRPKGVHVTHRALLNLVAAQHEVIGVTADDVALQFASFGFDAVVSEVFMALAYGASLVVAPSEARRDPAVLTELIRAHDVTVATLPPALLEVLSPDDLSGLRTLLAAGERLDGQVARAWARDRRLFNAYGPTETAVCASMGPCEPDADGEPPIGRPIANTRAFVLDVSLRPTPIGVPGELFVGGVGVARGYGGRPDLTAERFVADPFAADGSRLYRTGDRVRWDAEGRLVYLGRTDGQVKVRGFRVEPAEVEAALTALPQVRSAVVVARGEGSGRHLVAYAVPADAEAGLPDAVALRGALRPSLPEHLTPSAFVELATLPLTANGKIDRTALPDPGTSASASGTSGGAALGTPTEETLAGIWTELLGRDGIGGDHDFFALGGHSLLATQVMSRVRAALGVEAPVAWLFDHPTPAALGRVLDAAAIEGDAPGATVPAITAVPRDRPLPLSFAQQRVWFLDQLAPGSAEHNVPTTFRLDGPADPDTVQAALDALVQRHEVLRTRFVPDEHGVAHQVIDPDGRVTLAVTDLTGDPGPADAAERIVAADAAVPFDPGAGPLMSARLLRFGPDDHVLCVVLHHAVSDEWSAGILIREFTALHDALRAGLPADLPPLPVQYADVAVWQRERLSGDVLAAELDHWRERIADAAPLELPTDRPRPAVRSAEGDAVPVEVPPGTAAALRALSRRSGATMFMTLLASYAVLLGRIAGQDDVLVGTPVAGRNRAEAEGLIGCFVNTLVLRADLSGDPAPADVLARVRADALDAYAHQDLPFEKLVDALVVERDRSRHPLVQVLFNYDGEVPETPPVAPPGNRSTRFDLRLVLSDTEAGGLSGALEYSAELFGRATAERYAAAFDRVLETFGTGPDQPLSGFTLVGDDERRLLVGEWAGSGRSLSEPIGVHRLVRGEPDATAVVSGDASLTYRELDERAGRLAGYLRGLGVGPETVVGVCLPRGLGLVTAVLAVWRAGGAYVPLDPALPAERLAFVLADSRASLLVGAEDTVGDLPAGHVRMVVLDDAFTEASVAVAALVEAGPVHPDRLAYVIYTSGSTGRPKGVQVTHGGLTAYVRGVAERFAFDAGTYGMVQSAVTDFGNTMLFGALVSGGTLHLIDERTATDPALLRARLAEHPIDFLKIVPSHLAALAAGGLEGLLPARTLVFGGEAAPAGLVEDVLDVAGDRVVMNHYGPTEATVGVATSRLAPDEGVPIGRPLPHARLYVLDASLNPVPVGVPGELFIAGVGLARGYVGRPDITADRFVPDPFAADGARMYRSGDRVRWRAEGALDFLGRTDAQVKVRGHRVEPGEVEAALTGLHGVAAAVVVADGEGANRRLVGYVVPSEAAGREALSPGELRTALARRLPEHLIPAVFVELASLPRTPNGKIDRKALPAPDAAPAANATSGAPRTPTEELLAGLWAQVLGREKVGVHDNFFEMGGHSLLATQVVSRIRLALDVEVPLSALFDHPTVADLADAVAAARPGRTAPPITPAGRGGPLPLSFAQQRLWFLDQLEPGSSEYNSLVMLRLPGAPGAPSLRRALDTVVERHEVLRTRLVADDDGEPHQLIDPPAPIPLPVVDLSGAPDPSLAARDLIADAAAEPFDLATGPLLRAKLLTLAPDDHLLFLCLHHVVSDEWSAGVLRSELGALYEAFSRDEPSPLAPLPVQYADFAVWQRAWLSGDVLDEHLDHWRERLDRLPVLELPTDRTPPAERSSNGSAVGFHVPTEVTGALRALSRESGATMFMTLLAAFGILLSRYADQEDVAVGTPIANRNRAETEGLIGFFVNTLVMRTDLSGDPTFRELLDRVRRTALDAYAHQDLPFEQLVDALQPDRDRTRHPLFQVMFDYGQGGGGTAAPDDGDGIDIPWRSTLFDLTLVLEEDGDGLSGALEYATDLFDEATARRMTAHFGTLLAAVATDPGRRVADLPLLSTHELRRLVVEWNDTKVPLPAPRTVHELIAERTAAFPADEAVVYDEQILTYADLDERSNRLARHLRDSGVGPESVVGLHLPRGTNLLVAVLATWKAGGVYLPLDPEYPEERLAFMLEDSGARLLLTEAESGIPGWNTGTTIRLDAPETTTAVQAHASRPLENAPGGRHALACVIYTSGSTGRPKGVQIEHGSLMSVYGAWSAAFMPDGTRYRWLSMASASFDVFTGDLVRALGSGGTLVLGADRLQASATDVAEAVKRHAVNAFEAAPRLVDELVEHVERTGEPLGSLRLLLVTTDAWRAAAVTRTRRALGPDVMLRTAFGITEATIDSTSSALVGLGADGPAPIGGPLANTRVHVLDRRLNPVPVGVPGELFIGGTGVARGYAGRPVLTAERFVPDPFAGDGGRLYRSGDLVRLRPDGELEFLGRLDRQLKVRGHRVEPGEVEAVLTGHPGVAASVVAAHGFDGEQGFDGEPGVNGDARLVGYVVPGGEAADPPSTSELRAYLKRTLPDHLVPSVFVLLEALPVSPNGKVDRDALPAPDGVRPGLDAAFTAPSGPAEEIVAGIWAEVLGLDRVGAHDDFFDLGGHSLLATRVLARTRAAFAVRLGLADVFDHPTVAGLGAVVEARLLEEIGAMSEDEVARELGRDQAQASDGTDGAAR